MLNVYVPALDVYESMHVDRVLSTRKGREMCKFLLASNAVRAHGAREYDHGLADAKRRLAHRKSQYGELAPPTPSDDSMLYSHKHQNSPVPRTGSFSHRPPSIDAVLADMMGCTQTTYPDMIHVAQTDGSRHPQRSVLTEVRTMGETDVGGEQGASNLVIQQSDAEVTKDIVLTTLPDECVSIHFATAETVSANALSQPAEVDNQLHITYYSSQSHTSCDMAAADSVTTCAQDDPGGENEHIKPQSIESCDAGATTPHEVTKPSLLAAKTEDAVDTTENHAANNGRRQHTRKAAGARTSKRKGNV